MNRLKQTVGEEIVRIYQSYPYVFVNNFYGVDL